MYSPISLLILLAAGPAMCGGPIVTVYTPLIPDERVDQAFRTARLVVNDSCAEIGVRVVWRSTSRIASGCSRDPLETRIVVALLSTTPARISGQGLAFAEPNAIKGPCVYLLMDRITPAIALNPLSTSLLVGNALAHEIGHVLQGIIRHSDTGLMKARWTPEDIRSLRKDRFHFTAYDAQLILQALAPPDHPGAVTAGQRLSGDLPLQSSPVLLATGDATWGAVPQ